MCKNRNIKQLTPILVLLATMWGTLNAYAQAEVVKSFEPRTSANAPSPYTGKEVYTLQGDFTMVGNTNLTLRYYGDNMGNNNDMIYVNVDDDDNTINSSSATLGFPSGIDPNCTTIIYAGLYWSGRAHDNNYSPKDFTVGGRDLSKDKVKFKKEGDSYHTVTADDGVYPSGEYGNMYTAYADVTDYVRDHGIGEYFVADMALREGNGGSTGYYGGWGLIVIYQNASSKWRNISIFDGYTYAPGSTHAQAELEVSGFKATQYGPVRVTLGLMAGEGDVAISGDYFEIRKAPEASGSTWTKLKDGDYNSENNFFNSSINTPGARNPNLINNTGLDIHKFDIENEDNRFIGNNQTSTTFRYGTTQDTYIIYCIAFAVDAYVLDGEAINTPSSSNPSNLSPGQSLDFEVDLENHGNEAINDTKVTIPIPYNMHFVSAVVDSTKPVTGNLPIWIPPPGAPEGATSDSTPGGTLVWEAGTLPIQSGVLASMNYTFKVTTDCLVLLTSNCPREAVIQGVLTGTGDISQTDLSVGLVSGYESEDGSCNNLPIYDPISYSIDISHDFEDNCDLSLDNDGNMQFRTCSATIDHTIIADNYPDGTTFYDAIPDGTGDHKITGNFDVPNTADGSLTYYVVTPAMDMTDCYLKLVTRKKCYKVITNPMLPSKGR